MRTRDLLLATGALVLLASAAVVLFGRPSAAGELAPPRGDPGAAPAQPLPTGPGTSDDGAVPAGPVSPSAVQVVEPVFRRDPQSRDTSGWTSGVIAGDISLAVSVLSKVQTISIVVDELRNVTATGATPFRRVVPVTLGAGSPTFEIRDVPFSEYGYVVRAHAPGLNGGQATVTITADHPCADDLRLAITPGSPFSVLLRDQDLGSVALTDVRLIPVHEPGGRPIFSGRTDNYGSVVFEDVLAGDYQVFIGAGVQPLITPPVIAVQPGVYVRNGSTVLPQGCAITVPRGEPLLVAVGDRSGFPVAGVRVRLRAVDRRRLVEEVGETDVRGECRFANVLAGMWEVEVSKTGFQRSESQLTVKENEVPPEQRFQMIRLQ